MGFPSFYPLVQLILRPSAYARAPFGAAGPTGVTVHYTADPSVEAALASFNKTGYCYHLIVDRSGKVTQACFMDKSVWHAGKALWLGKSPNKRHIAVAVVSWGKLEPAAGGGWQSYAGTPVPMADVQMRRDNLTGAVGAWHAATADQERVLEEILRWAIAHGISPADICGHDECALPKGRKIDPGGVLSQTMAQLRAKLSPPAS